MAETDQARSAAAHRRADAADLARAGTRSPLGVARQFEQTMPDTKLGVMAGGGRASNLERPEPSTDAVREFCLAHAPGSA